MYQCPEQLLVGRKSCRCLRLSLRRSHTSLKYLEQSHVGLQMHTVELKKRITRWAMQAACKLTEGKSILAECPAPSCLPQP